MSEIIFANLGPFLKVERGKPSVPCTLSWGSRSSGSPTGRGCNLFNECFQSIFTEPASPVHVPYQNIPCNAKSTPDSALSLSTVDVDSVSKELAELDINKAVGPDKIFPDF